MLYILWITFFLKAYLWQTHLKRSEKDLSPVKSEKRLLWLCSEDKREGGHPLLANERMTRLLRRRSGLKQTCLVCFAGDLIL